MTIRMMMMMMMMVRNLIPNYKKLKKIIICDLNFIHRKKRKIKTKKN